jgi:hypothetical protein
LWDILADCPDKTFILTITAYKKDTSIYLGLLKNCYAIDRVGMVIKVCNRIAFYLRDDSTLFKRLISIYTFLIKGLESRIVVSNLFNILLFIHLLN